ncbi:MAG: hypothetical protein DRJ01_10075 [Bacteroidetes bacterium]|nr:MAG: hypothetical protein DRJ01_10075 [Bacteroidota bacterium]
MHSKFNIYKYCANIQNRATQTKYILKYYIFYAINANRGKLSVVLFSVFNKKSSLVIIIRNYGLQKNSSFAIFGFSVGLCEM